LFRYSAALRFATKTNQSELIPSMCCGFYTMEQCMVDTFADNGGCAKSDPNLRMAKFTKEFILLIFGDVFELICGNYSNLDNCNQNAPALLSTLNKYSGSTNVSFRNAYFVKYLVKLSQRIAAN
jgi:hypothetical protein